MNEIEIQKELLNKYNIPFLIKDGKILIEYSVYLDELKSIEDIDLFRNVSIGLDLNLGGLTECGEDFLKYTNIGDILSLTNIKKTKKDFLKYTKAKSIWLNGLEECDEDFLSETEADFVILDNLKTEWNIPKNIPNVICPLKVIKNINNVRNLNVYI